jgi:hypothetical protein
LEKAIDENVAALVDLIEKKYVSTNFEFKPFDFGRKVQYFTVDTISSMAFGKAFGDLATDSDVHQYIKTIEESLRMICIVTAIPWLSRLFQTRIMKKFLPSETDKIGFGKVIGFELSI